MYFWSWNPQYLLLQGIVIVFSTLTGVQSQDNKIVGELTITPEKTEPNRDVTLRCTFNLTKDETTLLYWNDKRGHTLYFYQKGKNITVGPEYKNSISNIKTDAGDHSLSLRVTGCNNSPYKCDVWMENSELILDKSIEIEHIASPVVFRDGKAELGDIEIPDNRTYTLLCKVPEATMEHNLTMVVEINGNVSVMNPSPRASSYNSTTCLYSCSLQKDYFLYTSDEVKVTCMAHYKEGKKKTTVSGTPDPCKPNPCMRGTCVEVDKTQFRCNCPDDWSGTTCDEKNPHCFGGEVNRDIPVVLGNAVTLECARHTHDYQYLWTDANNMQLLKGRTLSIIEAFQANQSVYICHATRSGCSQEQLTRIKLSVIHDWGKPDGTNPKDHIEPEVGESVKLECNPAGQPEPVVQWYRTVKETVVSTNDPTIVQSEVALGERSKGSVKWIIEQATLEDSGLYICRAFSHDVVEDIRNVSVAVGPRLGESKMLDMPIIIIIVVFAVIILIGIFTLAVVMCVKKKKGTVYSVRTTRVMSRYASLGR